MYYIVGINYHMKNLPCLSGGVSRDIMDLIMVISIMPRQPTTGTGK